MTIEHKRSSKAEIEDLVKARYSLIWITSAEEQRVEEQLRKLCVEREMRLEVWSITEGFRTVANGQGTRDVKDPMKAIDHVMRSEGRALFVLRDFHPFLKEPAVVRRLPATAEWGDCLDLADTPESFSEAVRWRLGTGLPEEQRRARGRLAAEGWEEKARAFEGWALAGPEPARPRG